MSKVVLLPRGEVAPKASATQAVKLPADVSLVRAEFDRHAWPAGEIVLQLLDGDDELCSMRVAGGVKLDRFGVTIETEVLVFEAVLAGAPALLKRSKISARVIADMAIETEIRLSWA